MSGEVVVIGAIVKLVGGSLVVSGTVLVGEAIVIVVCESVVVNRVEVMRTPARDNAGCSVYNNIIPNVLYIVYQIHSLPDTLNSAGISGLDIYDTIYAFNILTKN